MPILENCLACDKYGGTPPRLFLRALWVDCCRTCEDAFGADACTSAYDFDPKESFDILAERLRRYAPDADPRKLLGM